ncbi:helix-turn-helix transcriptional regulator [Acetobacteraceae bacterium H6797]|nr:helix-turn-helix transcriptional regulator [Acetobacteraceae bacterium H6797]
MAKPLNHPAPEALELSAVLEALSDPLRRAILARLAEKGEAQCSTFVQAHGTTKTNLSYHITRLRDAGLVWMRAEGAHRFVSLRREGVDARFPGLLDPVLAAAKDEPPVVLCPAVIAEDIVQEAPQPAAS